MGPDRSVRGLEHPRHAGAHRLGAAVVAALNEAQLDSVFANPGVGATARQEGFGGGDYPHAYPLPDGRVLWLFQDLHFSNDNVLGTTNAVHNGALVQEGNCWFIQGSMGRDFIGDLLTQDSRTWFWPMDGEIGYDGNLWIFMAEMRNPAGNGATQGALPARTWLAIVDPVSLRQLYFEPATNDSANLFGWSVVSTDQYSYLYSQCYRQFLNAPTGPSQFDPCTRNTSVARVPLGHFDAPPEYWNGSTWTSNAAAAVPIISKSTAYPVSVQWFGDTFVSVTKVDEWWGTAINIDRAPAPQGPWTTVQSRSVLADRKCAPNCGNYGVFLMPWLDANGQLVVALSNGGDFDLWRANAALYRPTFYTFPVPAASGGSAATPPSFAAGPGVGGFIAVDPIRLVDTREPGQAFGRLQPGSTYTLDLSGRAPAGATAVVLNLTADQSAANGWIRTFACNAAEPPTSNVNPLAGQAITNAAIVPLGDGRICVTTLAATDVIVDLNGWIAPSSNVGLVPVTARRLADTRIGLGGSARLQPGRTLQLPVVSPGAAVAVALSITAVDPSTNGYVTAWPCGTPRPTVSNLNPVGGVTRPNLVNVRVGTGGAVCLYTLEATDLIVDLVGEYRAGSGARYAVVTPQRLLDTRPFNHRRHQSNLSELVALAAEKRDIRLKTALERDIRLVSYEIGKIEIALLPNAEAELPNRLAKALLDWTGRRWGVSIAREAPAEKLAPTLHEIAEEAREEDRRGVRANPAIRAILERFPGTEIVAIRINEDQPAGDSDATGMDEPAVITDDDL